MTRGGKRENSGRKKLPPEIKRKIVNFRLNPEEAEKVRNYIKELRMKGKDENAEEIANEVFNF